MPAKLTIQFIRDEFEKEGYVLLSKCYSNCNATDLDYICPNGHKSVTSWNNWRSGGRCRYCYIQSRRITLEFIEKEFKKEDYILLAKTYKGNKQRLDYICPKGHRHSISWTKWQQGRRCPEKSFNYISNIETVRSVLGSSGFELINKKYTGSKQKIYYKCKKCGTINSVVWNAWSRKKNKCKLCKKEDVLGVFILNINTEGYKYLSGDYVDSRSILKLECSEGHEYFTNWFNWFTNKSRCSQCKQHNRSNVEDEIVEYLLRSDISLTTIKNDKALIKPHELDIIIPSKNIAIEYCGLRWHSELFGKDRKYHINKLNKCVDKDLQLITIFEDEWLFKKKIVLSRLENILNISNNITKIHARKCIIKEIPVKEAKQFCNENHLQGYNGSSIKLGAFYEDALVSVMTFSKPSIAKGGKTTKGVWELSRFCSKINHRITGIASRLLKFFEETYQPKEIFSYADRRWSDGNLYTKLGFIFVKKTQPNYWYIVNHKRIHRFAYRKKSYEPKNKTEWEIRKSQGLNRIWDCGNLKYQKVYKR